MRHGIRKYGRFEIFNPSAFRIQHIKTSTFGAYPYISFLVFLHVTYNRVRQAFIIVGSRIEDERVATDVCKIHTSIIGAYPKNAGIVYKYGINGGMGEATFSFFS